MVCVVNSDCIQCKLRVCDSDAIVDKLSKVVDKGCILNGSFSGDQAYEITGSIVLGEKRISDLNEAIRIIVCIDG